MISIVVSLLAGFGWAEIILTEKACCVQDAHKACERKGMKLLAMSKDYSQEADKALTLGGGSGVWVDYKGETVVYKGQGKARHCRGDHEHYPCLCYSESSCGSSIPTESSSKPVCKKGTKAPKTAKQICKTKCSKLKNGKNQCHSYSESDSWTSTHVSQEIKTRVPKKCFKRVYICKSSSCSSSGSSGSSISTTSDSCEGSWDTEEIVRPHKRHHYRKKVEVRDKVHPAEIRHEVVRKPCPKPKPCKKKVCHGGQCRLQKRGLDESEDESTSETSSKPAKKKGDKKKKPIEFRCGEQRYRAPIKFPSSSSSSSSSSSGPKSSSSIDFSSESFDVHVKKQGKCKKYQKCKTRHSKHKPTVCKRQRAQSPKVVYKVKKNKKTGRPYVSIPDKKIRDSKARKHDYVYKEERGRSKSPKRVEKEAKRKHRKVECKSQSPTRSCKKPKTRRSKSCAPPKRHGSSSSSSSSASSSSNPRKQKRGYKCKEARRIELAPISTSSTPKPIVLKKRHIKCK